MWFKTLPQRNLGQDDLTKEFYQTHEKQIISMVPKPFQKTEYEGTLANSVYEANSILHKLKGKYYIKRKLQTSISQRNLAKIVTD